jgi:nitronate monooxygenase
MKLQQLLGTELPIIQAPMAGVQAGALAAAVCNAGALGSLPCAMSTVETMKSELELIRSRTDRPFAVNFFVHQPPEPDPAVEARWRALLAPYYAEFGIDAAGITAGPGRAPFNAAFADALERYRPAVVSFHFGLPSADLVARVKSWGSKVLSSATTVEEALWLEAHGVDAVIAQGIEAGGHRGMFLGRDIATQLGTFALVPQVAAAVRVPVIAAGGIADARAVRAAMALGASGVQAGTSFLLCHEATTPAVNRAALRVRPHVTALTNLFTGRPSRGIVNRVVRELGPINAGAPAFPLATTAIAPLRARAEAAGSGDFSPLWSGQNASGCREVPAAEIVAALAGGLEQAA